MCHPCLALATQAAPIATLAAATAIATFPAFAVAAMRRIATPIGVVIGVVAGVAIVAAFASPLALALALAAMLAPIGMGRGAAPDAPCYLARRQGARRVQFTEAVWEGGSTFHANTVGTVRAMTSPAPSFPRIRLPGSDPRIVAALAEIERLDAAICRAMTSRHKTRAAAYTDRRAAIAASIGARI